ncbi:MAG: hypothetical protein H0X29_08160, partial [Parachlamydiaceae bacterium]|nr:hypothetical protein [Parachlamydiaceae bacterium]
MSSINPLNSNGFCSKFFSEQISSTCSNAISHPAALPVAIVATLTLIGSHIAYCGLRSHNNNKKIKAIEVAKQKEIELALRKQIESTNKKAEEILLKKELLIKTCEQIKDIENTNKETLDGLFISDWFIPVEYPEG